MSSRRSQPRRSRRSLLPLAVLATLICALVLSACGGGDETVGGSSETASGASEGGGSPGGVLTMDVSGDPDTLDPQLTTLDVFNHGIRTTVFDTLTHIDENLEIVPGMAESWEESPDGKTVTFKLRPGIKFHDGTPFTAADVAFSVERLQDPKEASPLAPQVGTVKSVEAVDPLTARFHLTAPTPALLSQLLLVQIVSEKSIGEIAKHPIGTGPFEFDEFVPGDHIKLSKFAGYYEKDQPKLDGIELKVVPDAQTRLTDLQTGAAQLIDGIDPKDVEAVEGFGGTTVIQSPPIIKYEMFQINTERKPFDDVRVRQAIAYAFNRPAFVDSFWSGLARPSVNPFVEEMPAYLAGSDERYAYDPDKAKKLLAEAGFDEQNPLSFELTGPTGFPTLASAALLLQDELQKIGVKVTINELDVAAWVDKIATTGDFDVTTDVYDTVPADPAGMFNSDNLAPTFNINRFNPPGYEKEVEAAATEMNPQKRIQLYRKLQERLLDEMPMVTIDHTPVLLGASEDVKGFSTGPTGLYQYNETTVR